MTIPSRPVYRDRDLPLFLCVRVLARLAVLMQSVALGWQVYAITHSALALGLVGLTEFLPMFVLALPAGEMADRFDPRRIIALASLIEAAASTLLLAYVLTRQHAVWPLYAAILLFGSARGFSRPANQSLLPFLVPPQRLSGALAWSSSVMNLALIVGPALGGFAYAVGPAYAYGSCLAASLLTSVGVSMLGGRRPPAPVTTESRSERLRAGIRFVRSRPVLFGSISLDLFAVLLGGAVSLLPIYARDILHAGPQGLGLLRSAPVCGAVVVAFALTRWPLQRRVGLVMFGAVALFGVATIVFGLSQRFALSFAALAVAGAADEISVYVRSMLVQLATPDEMRGRVSAFSTLFISASNELGGFESGVTAALMGTVPAVVVGGLGTLLVVGIWMRAFPALRRIDRMSEAAAAPS